MLTPLHEKERMARDPSCQPLRDYHFPYRAGSIVIWNDDRAWRRSIPLLLAALLVPSLLWPIVFVICIVVYGTASPHVEIRGQRSKHSEHTIRLPKGNVELQDFGGRAPCKEKLRSSMHMFVRSHKMDEEQFMREPLGRWMDEWAEHMNSALHSENLRAELNGLEATVSRETSEETGCDPDNDLQEVRGVCVINFEEGKGFTLYKVYRARRKFAPFLRSDWFDTEQLDYHVNPNVHCWWVALGGTRTIRCKHSFRSVLHHVRQQILYSYSFDPLVCLLEFI